MRVLIAFYGVYFYFYFFMKLELNDMYKLLRTVPSTQKVLRSMGTTLIIT